MVWAATAASAFQRNDAWVCMMLAPQPLYVNQDGEREKEREREREREREKEEGRNKEEIWEREYAKGEYASIGKPNDGAQERKGWEFWRRKVLAVAASRLLRGC
jgi:hypothetical protein